MGDLAIEVFICMHHMTVKSDDQELTQSEPILSQHDWNIVDWDVKPQYKQTHIKSTKLKARSVLSTK